MIDFTKVVSINCIVLMHFQQFIGSEYCLVNFFGGEFDFSMLVELLFIISGYFSLNYIQRLGENHEYKKMIVKRSIRLLGQAVPWTLFYCIVMWIYKVIEGNWFRDEPFSIINLVTSLLGVQFAWFIPPGVVQGVILGCNPPTWFIDSLLLCVVIMTILVWLSDKTRISIVWSFLFVVLIGVYGYYEGLNYPLLNWASCRGYYAFFFGIVLGMYDKKLLGCKYDKLLRGITIFILMTVGYVLYEHGIDKVYIYSFFLFPSLILLSTTGLLRKCFMCKIWCFLSDVSYEVYLCHFSFVLVFIILCNRGVISIEFASSSYVCMALYDIFVWVIAIVYYILIENNLLKKIVIRVSNSEK